MEEKKEVVGKEKEKVMQRIAALREEYKQNLLKMSEISLWLDSYDDIFSDFDSRPFSQRAVSDDFLSEARKASRDKVSGQFELKFIFDANKRNLHNEITIKKRLKEHFKKHFHILQKERGEVMKGGAIYTAVGIILMFIATFILFTYQNMSFIISFLVVILEPAGWFLFWEGLNEVIFKSKKVKPELEFYDKMSKCEISFLSY